MTTIAETSGSMLEHAARICERGVRAGVPPAWFGWRWLREETLRRYFDRGGKGRLETIHPAARADNPLPVNVDDAHALSDDPDWFGFSQRDVPTRQSGETLCATVPDCTVVTFTDTEKQRFWPTVINGNRQAFDLREMRFRPGHGKILRNGAPRRHLARATWITERVYDNHSHWLTAHLPKLCLLKAQGRLDNLLLPERRSAAIDVSLRMLGLDPHAFETHGTDQAIDIDELTLIETDRFRPELLRPVREMLGRPPSARPGGGFSSAARRRASASW